MSTTDSNSEVGLLAEALVEANDQLLALYELASITAGSLDEDEVVQRILLRAQRLLGADALAVDTDADHCVGQPKDIEALHRHQAAGDASNARVASSSATDPAGGETAVSAFRRASDFGTADTKLLDAVAMMLSGALHTARLHASAVTQAVMASDHETAARLAQSALPRWLPELTGIDVFARSEPARSAGGDLYCFDVIDDVLHFAVGDVSGKGLPAAIMMTNVISAANAAFHRHGSDGPPGILAAIDAWMYQSLSDAGMFVTLLVGSLDLDSGSFRLSNAGHSPVLLQHTGTVDMIPANHPPIGVLPIDDPEETIIKAGLGHRLVVASDGITEQAGIAGEMYGEERLIGLLRSARTKSAAELGAMVFDRVELYGATVPQCDDRTLFIVNVVETP